MIVKTEKISNLSVWTERDLNEKITVTVLYETPHIDRANPSRDMFSDAFF